MSTLTQSRHHLSLDMSSPKARLFVVPLGRFLYSLIFIFAGLNHFSSGSISYAASSGVPYAQILVPISGLLAVLGGLSIALGYKTRVGSLLLLIFLIPITFMMHNFWAVTDPAMMQMQMAHFMKNISLIGGAILFSFYGAGPLSIDNHIAKSRRS